MTRCRVMCIGGSNLWQPLVMVAGVPCSADWQVRTWQTDEGRPDNSVAGIIEPANGHLRNFPRGTMSHV